MAWSRLAAVAFLLCSWGAYAENRYIIFFKDKSGTPFSVSQPLQFLSQKAIDRRTKQAIAITEEDLPVRPDYVAQMRAIGARTFFTSRWMNCVLVETTPEIIDQIRLLPFVQQIDYVAPNKKLSGGRIHKISNKKELPASVASRTQLQMLGLDAMQAEGFRGEKITIAVFDGGFLGVNTAAPFQPLFQENRLIDSYDFIARSGNVYSYDNHGTEVLSIIGAYNANTFLGGAYKANFILYVTEDVSSEYRIEEYNWLFAAERADSAGVDVVNSSLGYNLFDDESMDYSKSQLDGKTAVISRAAGKLISKGVIVVCSAGNEGNNSWQLVTPPADVNGIVATGSISVSNYKSTFSSIGPTADKRIKPEVVALGSGTSIIKPNGTLGTNSGTSMACPLITSLVAGILQAYPQLTATEVYRTLLHSADQYATPDNSKGYGLPHFGRVKEYLTTFKIDDEILLYPNPVTGTSVKIAIKNPVDEPVHILIYSMEGKKVEESSVVINWMNNPIEYDLSALASGTYLVKVQSGENWKTTRLIKP